MSDWQIVKKRLEAILDAPDAPIAKCEAAKRLGMSHSALHFYLWRGTSMPNYNLGCQFLRLAKLLENKSQYSPIK